MQLSAAKLGAALAECLGVDMPSAIPVYMEELTRESLELNVAPSAMIRVIGRIIAVGFPKGR